MQVPSEYDLEETSQCCQLLEGFKGSADVTRAKQANGLESWVDADFSGDVITGHPHQVSWWCSANIA